MSQSQEAATMPRCPLPVLLMLFVGVAAGAVRFDDRPGGPGEWGFRPAPDRESRRNPPSFVWRPQRKAAAYELQASQDPSFDSVDYRAEGMTYNCHCPPKPLTSGPWHWRVRFATAEGKVSAWSKTRSFSVGAGAVVFPMPEREELLSRVPKEHPRLFVRPEQLPKLRQLAQDQRQGIYENLARQCERLLKKPPSTEEPPRYGEKTERLSEEWRKTWWGNRVRTIRVLNGAATLAFTRLLGGREEYGQLARRLLLDAAEWDPKGSTGYRYNDEAGMPYAYYFARSYTFLHDTLSEDERRRCREVMAIRGKEMYAHLTGRRHLWRPYSSHANRAWHFLGEVGIAFLGEIPEAGEWLWFATNVFYNAYPVWSDSDGGWHEGSAYWSSYIRRFTWWADVMRVALGIDAYQKPYFSQIGYYPMYLQPPGTRGGGFGDLTARRASRHAVKLMSIFAAQAANPHWQWYVEAHGEPPERTGYIGFIRGAAPKVEAKPPIDLPTSRCFRGTGQAMLNTNLLDAKKNVEVIFKSSPFGTQSHGYEAQNAFLLYAFGERLLIRSGRRDIYGSDHHRNWMWHTKSVNSITVNGKSQGRRVPTAKGKILGFYTSEDFDYVAGEAGQAYGRHLKRFTRHIVFVKPHAVLVFDRLEAPKASTFEWRLHAPTEMDVRGPRDIRVANGRAACRIAFLAPAGLDLDLTDKFDPPPRPRVKLVEWHLTAQTALPTKRAEFVTLLRPHRVGQAPAVEQSVEEIAGGYRVDAALPDGRFVALLRSDDQAQLADGEAQRDADLFVTRYDSTGEQIGGLLIRKGHVVSLHDMSSFELVPPDWESRVAKETGGSTP
jgi:hypothetical protein